MKQSLTLLAILVTLSTSSLSATGGEIAIPFTGLSGWQEKSFKGHTSYRVLPLAEKEALHAEAAGTASGLYHKVALSRRDYPVFKWSWQVPRTIAAEDAIRKSGDDFAARVYLIFPGRFFWQTRALVYVYSSKLPPGSMLANPFTDRVAVFVIASGPGQPGVWRTERRRYVDDFRAYFNVEPPDPVAVAVMTDGDNTSSHAEAWYADFAFVSE